jgi:hypothetical protein
MMMVLVRMTIFTLLMIGILRCVVVRMTVEDRSTMTEHPKPLVAV